MKPSAAVILLALLMHVGFLGQPAHGDNAFDSASSGTCVAAQNCYQYFCNCLSSQTMLVGVDYLAEMCLIESTATCATRTRCLFNLTDCLGKAALSNKNQTTCSGWAENFNLASLAIAAGKAWNTTDLYSYCAAELTNWTTPWGSNSSNATSGNTTCSFTAPQVCASPVQVVLILRISGNFWGTILLNQTAYLQVQAAMETDLTNVLSVPAKVLSLANGSLIVQFSVPGTLDATLSAALARAAASANWLTSTKAVYAANGGTDTISVLSLAPVGGTPIPVPGPPTTRSPPTPATTGAPGGTRTPGTYSPQSPIDNSPSLPLWAILTIVGGVVLLGSIIIVGVGISRRRSARA
jgi:hypothetical protein